MLCSLDKEERLFAIDMIFSIRGENEMGDTSVRFRVLPMLNIMATKLKDLICWDNAMEPVVTASLSKPQLEQYREEPMLVKYYCCHTQGIERAVKEVILITFYCLFPTSPNIQVTAACSAVYGADRRDGFIRGRAQHRELVPKLNSKQDFAKLSQLSLS